MTHDTHPSSTAWSVDAALTTAFDFDYQGGRDHLLRLYDKGTRKQWLARIASTGRLEVDPTNPLGMPDESIPISGSPLWDSMSDTARDEVRRHRGLAILAVPAR